MSKKRLLPEAAYDFWCRDGRNGELTPKRHTLWRAKRDLKMKRDGEIRGSRPWAASCWTLEWRVNERKVLRMVTALRRIQNQRPEDRPWVNPCIIAREALTPEQPMLEKGEDKT